MRSPKEERLFQDSITEEIYGIKADKLRKILTDKNNIEDSNYHIKPFLSEKPEE